MEGLWRSKSIIFAALFVHLLKLDLCLSLNNEGVALLMFKEKVTSDPHGALSNWGYGVGVESPCSWFGVECSQGYVVALNLKDLCLSGTLAPDIGDLVHVKSIILRNNSFSGFIPENIVNLKELEILDLGYNNFIGQLPRQLGNKFSLISREKGHTVHRKLLQTFNFFPFPSPEQLETLLPPDSSPSPSPSTPAPAALGPATAEAPSPSPVMGPSPAPAHEPLTPSPSPSLVVPISPSPLRTPAEGPHTPTGTSRNRRNQFLIMSAATGGPVLLLLLIGLFFWKSGKVSTVKPWATGLSGQLQRAFVSGVPKLKRSELVAACEDFSNVIGSSSLCTLYKGTLSSGVEIAVASIAVASAKGWSSSMETQFRRKIDTLSKVNHKNFVNLLGYCVADQPFTRMMVFEYAPNGTLFEHLHIQESDHLDWPTRLRISMGICYCLDHMHQLTPPLPHKNLNSSAIYLTDDYAAKISDFAFSADEGSSSNSDSILQGNVYSFGVLLFEMMTGRLPYTSGSDPVEDWAMEYLSRGQQLPEMVDPTLESHREDQLQQIGCVINLCVNPDPILRPSMNEVCARMRKITGMEPEGALPKVSPLWWAELEILSTEAS